ncbi:hypothetical protein GCM10010304_82000 [Streptomyces roseoviolaceus]
MSSDVLVAVVLIFGIVLTAACYAVRRLETRPARIASVLVALTLLVGALVPVVRLLTESATPPAQVVAPSVPGPAVAPTVPTSPPEGAGASSTGPASTTVGGR